MRGQASELVKSEDYRRCLHISSAVRGKTGDANRKKDSGKGPYLFMGFGPCPRGMENHPLSGWRAPTAAQQNTLPSSTVIVQVASPEGRAIAVAQKANSLAHTKWPCKYHIVFAPKHGRKEIYNQCRRDLGEILRQLCQWKGAEIIEGHLMSDHVHMLAGIPPKISVSSLVGYPRGKSSLLMFDRHANLRHEFGNRRFWAEGHCVSTVGPSEATIAKHVREQERADIALDRPGVKEYEDPFARGPQSGK